MASGRVGAREEVELSDSAGGQYLAARPRILRVYPNAHIWKKEDHPTDSIGISVAVLSSDVTSLADTLQNLALQTYENWEPIVVCLNHRRHRELEAVTMKYKAYLPNLKYAAPPRKVTIARALNVALSLASHPLFCSVLSHHGLHSEALRVIAAETQQQMAQAYHTAAFVGQENWRLGRIRAATVANPNRLWSGISEPGTQMAIYWTELLRKLKGFRVTDGPSITTHWDMMYHMLDKGMDVHYINAALYLWRDAKMPLSAYPGRREGIGLRKVLILKRWPHRYLDLPDE